MEYSFSLRGFLNAIQGRSNYSEERKANPSQVFQYLRELQGRTEEVRLTNYYWVPEEKKTISLTPEEAARLLEKKIKSNPGKGAIEFEMDHFVYQGRKRAKHIVEIYKAFRDVKTGNNTRLPGKHMKLEFLVSLPVPSLSQ